MPIQHTRNQYLIPRGRAYFDPFNASEELTGEIDLGNCPDIKLTVASEKSEHYSSQTGLREKDGSWVVQINRTGSVTVDNFSPQNAALWLAGTYARKVQQATPVADEIRSVLPGRQYQLGANAANPLGVRNVTGVTVKSEDGQTTFDAGVHYNVDLETGRVQILERETGGIPAGKVAFGYTPVAGQYEAVASGAKAELSGALRIVSDNAAGGNRDWYLPKVTLSPNGDLPLIAEGTDPVAMEMGLEVLKPANAEAVYCDGRPVPMP